MKRGRIWYLRLQRDGKDYWKSTKTAKVTLARVIRDEILEGIKAEQEKEEIPPEQRLTDNVQDIVHRNNGHDIVQ